MSKLPFKKKTSDEEEEYETDGDGEEDELEDTETSNEERTQFIQTSDLAEKEAEEFEEEEDEDEEGDEPQGLKDKIQWQVDQLVRKIKSLGKKKNQASDADEDEELDEDRTQAEIKKPDQKKRLIQGLIVIALVYFIADEFLKEETVPEATPQLKARPDQVPVADTPVDPVVEESPASETTDSGLSEAVIADPSDTSTEGMPTDTVSDTDTTITDTTTDTMTDIDSDTPPTETNDSTPAVDEPIISEDSTPPASDETIISEDSATPPSQPDMDQVGQGQVPNDVFGDLSSPIGESEGDLTEKILQDLETQTKTSEAETPAEYVAPPDYEYQGRGLVYNCRALHWACVDGPSYKVCEQNAAYLKQHDKAPECYPFNIYEATKGCTNMQNRMVSSGASTDFCKSF